MRIKTVNVTNPRNVLVQIPGCVIANWAPILSEGLDVSYDDEDDKVTIRPAVYRRSDATTQDNRVAITAGT